MRWISSRNSFSRSRICCASSWILLLMGFSPAADSSCSLAQMAYGCTAPVGRLPLRLYSRSGDCRHGRQQPAQCQRIMPMHNSNKRRVSTMIKSARTLLFAASLAAASAASAQTEYARVELEIDIAKPAAEVWAKVGGYCDIQEWAGLACEITSGDGGFGTVRSLLGGRILEILVAQTELSYGYAQPAVEGRFYDLYHGFM